MRTRLVTTAFAAVLALSTSLSGAAPAAAATYSTVKTFEQIAPDAYWATSVADASGALHAVFARYLQSGIWYLTNASGSWKMQQISSTSGQPDLAIDGSGKLYVVYNHEGENPGIRVLTNRSGSWVGQRLTDQATDRFPSIAVDSLGEIHIAFGEGQLVYLTNRRGFWSRRDLLDGAATRPSIALDANRRVHIAYDRWDGISYITDANGVSWVNASVSAAGQSAEIAVRGTTPAIAYVRPYDGSGSGGILFATKGATSWSSTPIRTGYVNAATAPSLRLDTTGKAHVAYVSPAEVIEYATNASGAWVFATVGRGNGPTVVLGPSGVKHFTFWSSALYLRSSTMPNWTVGTVSTTVYDAQPSIAMGPDDVSRLVYAVPFGTPGLRFGMASAEGFAPTRITYADDREPDLFVDAAGASHVAFVRPTWSANELWYGTNATGSWAFDLVATDTAFTCPALAVGPTGHVHVVARRTHEDQGYIYFRPVWYTDATGDWVVRDDLPIVTGADGCPDVAVDGDDVPHVVYVDTNQAFYTRFVADAWVTDTFGDTSYRRPAIAIAPDGDVVISYGRQNQYDSATGGLYTRTNATGSWVTTLVGKTADPDVRHGLAIDASGAIHLAYRGFMWDVGLLVSSNESGSWRTIKVRDQDVAGPSIAVSSDGDAEVAVYADSVLHYRE
jgi:hypothetical protein